MPLTPPTAAQPDERRDPPLEDPAPDEVDARAQAAWERAVAHSSARRAGPEREDLER